MMGLGSSVAFFVARRKVKVLVNNINGINYVSED